MQSILRFFCSGKRFSLRIDGTQLKASLDAVEAEGWRDQLRERFPNMRVSVVKAKRGLRR